jgi:hypothetical protein
MLDEITKTIFPNHCEVIEIEPGSSYVYPIFKCGRSSLYETMPDRGWNTVTNHDIANIAAPITVFVRDPRERFYSGVNTYIQHLLSKDPDLDVNTILYFVDNYLFLNRHYAPQFFWLMNLASFGGSNQLLQFEPMHKISELTDLNSDAGVQPITAWLANRIQDFDWQRLELYMFLDQIVFDHVNQCMTFGQLIEKVHNHSELYHLVFERSKQLINLVDVVPKT